MTAPRRTLVRAVVAALAFVAGCSDSATGPKQSGGAGVSITPHETTIDVGATTTLTATVKDASGATVGGAQVFWASEDTALAVVSPQGLVTAKAPGTVRIGASVAGSNDIATVTIRPQPVASVVVSPLAQSVVVGGTLQLHASALNASGQTLTDRPLTWRSSNEAIARVDANGLVTAVAPGAAAITVSSAGGPSASAAITVVSVPIAGITLSPTSVSLVVGQTAQLTATAVDGSGAPLRDRPITWTSSNESIASVSSTGLVIARAPGSATITASSEGKSASASVAVGAVPASGVIVSPSTPQLVVGQSVTLTAIVTDANGAVLTGRPVAFSSDNAGIATVSSSGVVTGVAPGTTTIRATSEGKTGTATVTVTPVPVASVAVSPASATLIVGGQTTLTATVKDASGNTLTGRPVTWASSNPSVVTVSATGVVTAVGAGEATVFASSEGKVGQAAITVNPVPVASVAVTPATATVAIGQTQQLTATVRDAAGNALTGRTVTWSSSNPSIALVSSAGLVTAVGPGTATITATAEGKSGTATVTVPAPPAAPVASVSVTPASKTLKVGEAVQLTAVCLDALGAALSGRTVTWVSDKPSIAMPDTSEGTSVTVRAKKEGDATITATCEGKTDTSAIKVTK